MKAINCGGCQNKAYVGSVPDSPESGYVTIWYVRLYADAADSDE